jgi:hypothetical protein
MQFPQLSKPQGSWIFFQWKYMTRAFRNDTSHWRAGPFCESVFKTPKYTAKKLQSRSHFTLPPFFTIKEKSFILWEIFLNLCLNAQINIPRAYFINEKKNWCPSVKPLCRRTYHTILKLADHALFRLTFFSPTHPPPFSCLVFF